MESYPVRILVMLKKPLSPVYLVGIDIDGVYHNVFRQCLQSVDDLSRIMANAYHCALFDVHRLC